MFGIESHYGDSSQIEQFKIDYGPISYPMFSTIDNDSILTLYNIYSTPNYYIVCPDKSYRHVNFLAITDMIDTCLAHTANVVNVKKDYIKIYNSINNIVVEAETNIYQNLKLSIFDITGRKIKNIKISTKKTTIPVYLKNGVYIVKLYSSSEILKTQKIVVQ